MPGGVFRAVIEDCEAERVADEISIPDQMEVPVGINKHGEFEVFPNPSRGLIQLGWDLPEETSVQVDLFTPSGQLLSEVFPETRVSAGRHRERVLLPDLPAGVYWLVMRTPYHRITKQLFIMQ
jgi:hypothetical protein